MYRLGTWRRPATFMLAGQLAHAVVEKYVANYIRTHPDVSRQDAVSNNSANREIAAEISRGEKLRKPAGSTAVAYRDLRMRYERLGKQKIELLRKSLRKESRRPYVEVDEMRERLADYFARNGEERGRGPREDLYPEELGNMRRKPDRQIMGIYFTYFSSDGMEKPRSPRLTTEQRAAEESYTEEDGVPDVPFDTLAALHEKRRIE